PPTDENVNNLSKDNPLKRQRVDHPSPIKQYRSVYTQTTKTEMISSSTSPTRHNLQSGEDIDMSSNSNDRTAASPDLIVIEHKSDDQSLKMARDYFGGKPYVGQQKVVSQPYPTDEEMKLLVAQDPKKAANFIFHQNKNTETQYPPKDQLIKFFSEAWNKAKPPNGNSIKPIKVGNDFTIKPGPENSFKYLGVRILQNGLIQEVTVKDLKTMISKVDKTKLDGRSKFRLMERYGLPQLLFIMENSDQTRAELRKLNGCYRNFVRKIHSLRHDFPNDGLHLKPHNGGLGATDIEERVARGKYNSATKMINDNSSKAFTNVVEKSKVKKIRADNAKYLSIGEDDTDLKDKHQDKLINHLSKSARVNSSAKVFFKNKRANKWINNSRIPNKMKTDFLKLRYNIMPTRSSTKFFNGGKTRCRGCGGPSESVKHLISKCSANQGLITLRHNAIIKELIRIGSRQEDTRIYQEKVFNTAEGRIKPDLILVNDNTAKVFEVAVTFEDNENTLNQMYDAKFKKYKKHQDIIAESLQVERVIFEPLILGAMGDLNDKSANAIIRSFKTNKYTIADILLIILRKSRNMVYNITQRRSQ
ncbi:hypothetical protein SNEBB_010516, partial [Seison nebaliae]